MNKQPLDSVQGTSSKICLGSFISPHGVRGAIKVKTFTEVPQNLIAYGPLMDDQGHIYHLTIIGNPAPDIVVVTVEGIKDRNQAEILRGKKLYIDRNLLPALLEDEFYLADLVGLQVTTNEGQLLGTVKAVNNYGAGDFLEVASETGQSLTIPFRKEAIDAVDLAQRKLTVFSGFVLSSK